MPSTFDVSSIDNKFIENILLSLDYSNDHLKAIRLSLGTLDSMPSFSLINSACSVLGNESVSSFYHLLHGELEWRWTYLTIIYHIEKANNLLDCPESDFKCELKLLMYDLLTLSVSKFNKVQLFDINIVIK